MMKKICFIVLFVLACGLVGCGTTQDNKYNYQGPVAITSKFSMAMVEKDSFYYPTIKGSAISPVYPDKTEVCVADYVFELEIENIVKIGDGYLLSFNMVYIFGQLNEGEYTVRLRIYKDANYYILESETIFFVDTLYTGMGIINWETGESFYAMDKESNWIGPY